MELTADHILQVCPRARRVTEVVAAINELCPQYRIDTPERLSMFLGQCLHESGCFRYMEEIWGPTKWQIKYEGNKRLGNVNSGDGRLYKGRGLIQLTGRYNYMKFADWAQDNTVVTEPTIVAEPKYAVLSAIYFWDVNRLNRFADTDDIEGCTRAVNGSQMLGLQERTQYYEALLAQLKV